MQRLSRKILSFVLLATFLTTSLGGLLGCVWCEKGSLSETHRSNHLDNHSDNHVDKHPENSPDVHAVVNINGEAITLDQHYHESGDSCVDNPIQLSYGIICDVEQIKHPEITAILSIDDLLAVSEPAISLARHSYLKPPQKISQTILFHRTIVLLS